MGQVVDQIIVLLRKDLIQSKRHLVKTILTLLGPSIMVMTVSWVVYLEALGE